MLTEPYYRLSYQVLNRSMPWARYQRFVELYQSLEQQIVDTMPRAWFPIGDLAHIPTRTYPERLASVQDGWGVTQSIPIMLYDHPDGLRLWNGNHRLTTARTWGLDRIMAILLPFSPAYTASVDRQLAILRMREAEDMPDG